MKKTFKKTMAILLVTMMLVTMLPLTAFAETVSETDVSLSDVSVVETSEADTVVEDVETVNSIEEINEEEPEEDSTPIETESINTIDDYVVEDTEKENNLDENVSTNEVTDTDLDTAESEFDYYSISVDEEIVFAVEPEMQMLTATMTEREAIVAVAEQEYKQYGNTECIGRPYREYAWCARFVSWCARQAEISTSTLRSSVWAHPFDKRNGNAGFNIPFVPVSDVKAGRYSPKPGDLVFYDFHADGDTDYDHVGLVCGVSGNKITTIEGNTQLKLNGSYVLGKKTRDVCYSDNGGKTGILGYGVPNYSGESSLNVTNYIPESVVLYNSNIYSVYNDSVTWKEAQSICEKVNGHLVTITSEAEENVVSQLVKSQSKDHYWIGLSDSAKEGTWQWITGEKYSYSNWRKGEPSDTSGKENYVEIYNEKYDLGTWNDSDGNALTGGFICEIESATYKPASTLTYNGKRYEVYDEKIPWCEANEFAKDRGGNLVAITDSGESNALVDFLNKNGTVDQYWIGATSYKESEFKWVTGEPFSYENWVSGEPNNDKYEEYFVCLYINTDTDNGKWNDSRNLGYGYKGAGFIIEYNDAYIARNTIVSGNIYSIYDDSVTWKEAQSICEKVNGHLVTITSEAEENVVSQLVKGQSKDHYWIGLSDAANEGTWQWVTGEKYNYSNWRKGEPSDTVGEENYVEIYNEKYDLGTWNDNDGNALTGGFICEIESATYKPASTLTYNGKRYEVYDEKIPWCEANEFAKNKGGNLVAITDSGESNALVDFLNSNGTVDQYWIGATSYKESEFKWVTGESFSYENWASGEPNNDKYEEYFVCLYVHTDADNGKWNDSRNLGYGYKGAGFIVEYPVSDYTITYDANGGTNAPESQSFKSGDTVSISTDIPTREGYQFVSWNTKADGSGTNYAFGNMYTLSDSITLYAQWEPVNLSISPDSAIEVGTSVTLTATGGNTYKFYYEVAGSWVRVQDFSSKNTCTWIPSQAGTYTFYCDIKDANGNTTCKTARITVTAPEKFTAYLKFAYASPQKAGTTIKLTASATGGKGALKYKFYSECNGVWTKLWDYDTKNIYNWHATTVGTHTVYCDVMDEEGNVTCAVVKYEIVKGEDFVADLNANRISGQLVGTEIRLLGGSSNGTGTVKYKFYYEIDGNWVRLCDFSTQDYFLWTPTKPGYYNLYMDAQDSAGHTASKRLCITIDEGQTLKVTSVTFDPTTGKTGSPTTITAKSTGGSGTVTYKFYYEMNGSWVKLQDFSEKTTCTWTPTKAGTYHIYVDAIDGTKNTQCLMVNYTVK